MDMIHRWYCAIRDAVVLFVNSLGMRQQVLSAAEDIEDNTTTAEVIEDAEDNTTAAEVIEDIEGNTTAAEVIEDIEGNTTAAEVTYE
jgi:hypothetical protein